MSTITDEYAKEYVEEYAKNYVDEYVNEKLREKEIKVAKMLFSEGVSFTIVQSISEFLTTEELKKIEIESKKDD